MNEIEEKLARILVAEADRHEVPRFDPYRIAENAGRRMSWYRKPLVMLAGLLVVGGGATGVVLGAASGGDGHKAGPQVTVTFQSPDTKPQPVIGGVEQQVLRRAAAEGLKDVEVRLGEHPFTLEVTGRAADVERLKTLGTPGILQMRPVLPTLLYGPQPITCGDISDAQRMTFDAAGFACTYDHSAPMYIGAPNPLSYGVVKAMAHQEATGGQSAVLTGNWEVDMTFDAAGTRAFANLTGQAYNTGSQFAVCIDGVVYSAPTVMGGAITDGNARITGTFTEQQAKLLAAEIANPLPPELENARVTVSPISTR